MVPFFVFVYQGIGLSLEEAIMFWRQEFTKSMDVDKVSGDLGYLSPPEFSLVRVNAMLFELKCSAERESEAACDAHMNT